MKKIMKEIMPKLVLAAILVVGSGIVYTLQWGHAHAEEKVQANTTAIEIHTTEYEIEGNERELTQIHLSPNRDDPYVMGRKQKIIEKLKQLRERLIELKS